MFVRLSFSASVLVLAMFSQICLLSAANPSLPTPEEMAEARRFVAAKFEEQKTTASAKTGLIVVANNGAIEKNSRYGKPLKIVGAEYARGIACHATSKIIVQLPSPGKKFSSQIGLDNNRLTLNGRGTVVFSASIDGRKVFQSDVFQVNTPAKPVEIDLQNATKFILEVGDAGDGIGWDQSDWAEARVELADGKTVWLGDLPILEVQDGLFSTDPPFSFTYNGKPSSEFLGTWKTQFKSRKIDDQRTARTGTYADPAGGLIVRCEAVEYNDYPTVEWTLYFKNTGKTDSPIIENIQSLDVRWHRDSDREYLLHHNIGSPADGTDYTPLETVLTGGVSKHIAAVGGCSTQSDMSYFNLQRSTREGLIAVIGWPGQWATDFIRDADRGIHLRAGQELTHFKLHPSEEIRTPLTVLQFWKSGDWLNAQNIWRRWMIAHNLPRPGGKLPSPQLSGYSGRVFNEMERANEANQILFIDRYLEAGIKLDYWWMDAGWYIQNKVGDKWELGKSIKSVFRAGLRAVCDHAHSKGLKTLLWFEPERVASGTWLAEHHPEWILGGKAGGILNLGNSDALKWLIDHVDQLLIRQGIDLYRQDFNTNPLKNWRDADAEDRQGITEIRHIEGLLAYWDELQRRHPDMLIDECAGGGRRNDLEMMRRAVPLWRSDFFAGITESQCMTYGISMWLPYYGTGVFGWETPPYDGKVTSIDPYVFWSKANPSVMCAIDIREKDVDYDMLRHLFSEWREISPLYYGDYYPLTKCNRENDAWIAWEFYRPEDDSGIVQAFRRSESVYESIRVKLRGLDPKAKYQITRLDSREKFEMNGKDLLEKGLLVAIGECPGAAIIKFRRMP